MLILLCWLSLHLFYGIAGQRQQAYVVLNQTNVAQRYPLAPNRVQCQNVTDKAGPPLLVAADDVVLSVPSDAQDCDAVLFSFTTVRTRQDLNPSSITLQLLRHNATSGGPSDAFFQITRQWPDNNAHWQFDAMGVPQQTDLLLQRGDLSDLAGATPKRFDLHDAQLLPPGATVWVAVWATVPLHLVLAGYRANGFYWATLTNDTSSSPVSAGNKPFWYKDTTDLLGYGWRQWTPAQQVEPWLGIQQATQQLAWRVSLRCVVAPPTSAPTPAPTPAPTLAPIVEPSPQPTTSSPPVATIVPTGPLASPVALTLNETQAVGFNTVALAVPVAVAGTLTLCLTVGCLVARRRALNKRANLRELLTKPRSNPKLPKDDDTEIEMAVTYAPNPLYGQGSRDNTMRVYTSGHELVSVSLSDVEGETRAAYREIFNDRVAVTDDDDF